MEVNQVLQALQYGSTDDKLEALTIARGKVNEPLLQLILDPPRAEQLAKEVSSGEALSVAEVKRVRSAIVEWVARAGESVVVAWYAIIVLVDLGDTSDECLENLMLTSRDLISACIDAGEEGGFSRVNAAFTEFAVQKETLRALSRFKDSPKAGEIIRECFEGKHLVGKQAEGGREVLRKSALYAFGALGSPEYRGLVEHWATRAKKHEEIAAARTALALWGQADYDVIVNHAEGRKPDKKGFFGKLFG